MTKSKVKTAYQLAEEHWNWLQVVLETQRVMEGKLFKDAFIHGYKHGQEDIMMLERINKMIKNNVKEFGNIK